MPLFGRKEKGRIIKLLAIHPYKEVEGKRGSSLIMGERIGGEWYERKIFISGLELNGSDINFGSNTPIDEPMEGGVIIKAKDAIGGTWWLEITKEACERAISDAKNLERAGHYDDAAIRYESLGRYEEAGRVRHKAKARYEYKVVIDFAQLTSKLGEKGLALQVIECPHCGGKVDMPKDGNVAKCKSCGNNIHAVDIFEKFKNILGT